MKIQLLADTEHFRFFSDYLEKIDGIEMVNEEPDFVLDYAFLHPHEKLSSLTKLESSKPVVISNTLTVSATAARRAAGKHVKLVGAPMFPHYLERQKTVEIALPLGHTNGEKEATEFFAALGKTTELVQDSVAGVFPRTLAMIINEAAFAVQEKIASVEDIDTAMKLGTNYPKGPLAWCDEIGAPTIVAVLDALAKEYGEDRYRAASLLRRHAEGRLLFYQSERATA